MRLKISHFWSPNFRASRFGAKNRGEGEEQEEKEKRSSKKIQRYGIISMEFVWNSKVLYGFPWNCRTSSLSPNLGFC